MTWKLAIYESQMLGITLYSTKVSFDTSEENHVFKRVIFSKFFGGFFQPHNQVKYRQKNKMFSEVFTKWTIVLKIVTFLTGQSLT